MHTTVLLVLLDMMYPGGHYSPTIVSFGDNVTEVANIMILPKYLIVYYDYRKHATWEFWVKWPVSVSFFFVLSKICPEACMVLLLISAVTWWEIF
jgi:hypothetical protein